MTARAVLDAALAAKGLGLTAVRTLVTESELEMARDEDRVRSRIVWSVMTPDRLRVDMIAGDTTWIEALDGAVAWQSELGVAGEHEDPAQLRGMLWRDPDLILTRHLDPDTTLARLDDDGGCAVIRLTSRGGLTATVSIDLHDHRLVALAYQDHDDLTVEWFADYRVVGGVQIAHDRRIQAGAITTTARVVRVEIDGPVDAAIFRRPSY